MMCNYLSDNTNLPQSGTVIVIMKTIYLRPSSPTPPEPPTYTHLASAQLGCFPLNETKCMSLRYLLTSDITRKSLRRRDCMGVFVSDAPARRRYSDGKIEAAYRFYK